MLIYGAGGHAKVVVEILEARNIAITGFFDDNPDALPQGNHTLLGSYLPTLYADTPLVIAIGNNRHRREIAQKIRHTPAAACLHPQAYLSPSCAVGEGSMVMMGACIQAATEVGRHCIINTGAIVEHDCLVSDFAHIAPGAVLCGGVRVGVGTLIGANATILPGIHIGKDCIVGAGVVVRHYLADGQILKHHH